MFLCLPRVTTASSTMMTQQLVRSDRLTVPCRDQCIHRRQRYRKSLLERLSLLPVGFSLYPYIVAQLP